MDEAVCRCTAREAKAKLSPEGWRVFVLQATGKTNEASEVALTRFSKGADFTFAATPVTLSGR